MDNKRYFRYFTYIQPVIKNRVVRTYGYAIFTIIMTIVFIFFAIKPTIETIAVLTKQLSDQQTTLKALNDKTQALATARSNYQQIPITTINKINTAFPTNLDIESLTSSLEDSTLSTQASISALHFQPIEVDLGPAGQTVKEIDFTFNIEGSFADLKTVLNRLKSTPRVLSITNIIFNKVEGENIILMSTQGKAYYIR